VAEIVVIGVGNRMRSDDGAGPAVLDRLGGLVPTDVGLVESMGDVAQILDAWKSSERVVIVDAVMSGSPPGTVRRLDGRSGVPTSWRSPSSHLIGLAEAIELGGSLGSLPDEVTVFGIEAENVDGGTALTASVGAAVDEVAEEILMLVSHRDA
jgi:hydrogenase maturation protease